MNIKSRITAFISALCVSAVLPFNVLNISAEEKNVCELGAMPMDISDKIRTDLNFIDTRLYSSISSWEEYDFSDMESLYSHYDISEYNAIYEEILKLADEHADFASISDMMDMLYEESVKVAELYGIVSVLFYSDTGNSVYTEEMEYTYNTYNSMKSDMKQFVKRLALDNFYYDSLVNAMGKESVDSYINENDISEEEYNYRKELKSLNTKYYTLLNSSATETEFAELYLDTVKLNNAYARLCGYDNYIEYAYDGYYRDYTVEEGKAFCQSVNENMSPVFTKLRVKNMMDENYYNFQAQRFSNDELIEIIDNYSLAMSEDINASCKYMMKTKSYQLGISTVDKPRYKGAFTIFLPGYNVPYIFVTLENSSNDLTKLVHEFGHYNEYYHSRNNGFSIDVSEISSQSMELLYSNFYDKIFEEKYSDISVRTLIVRKLWSLISGAMVAEFETFVYENEDISEEELIKLYDEIEKKYTGSNGNLNWQAVSHIFDMPGYYISYSVSSAASFEIWNTSVNDFEKAVSDYTDVCKTSSSMGISETLSKAGMNDIFDNNTIKNMAMTIQSKYIEERKLPDVNGDGQVTAEDAFLILFCVTGSGTLSDEEKLIADADGDGEITSFDALIVLKKVVE